MKQFIAYIRVSTTKQGSSGLGLDAQSAAITLYATTNACECKAVYREVESGKNNDRPELRKAIAHAKRLKIRLVIAKLDRLARNVHFVSGLMESGCDFVACDNPTANKLTIHILSAVAENEAEMISIRTKVALQAAKARGQLLGSARPGHWEGRENVRSAAIRKAQKIGTKVYAAQRLEESQPVYDAAREFIDTLDRSGMSLQDVADKLNAKGLTTATGKEWGRMQVSRLLAK